MTWMLAGGSGDRAMMKRSLAAIALLAAAGIAGSARAETQSAIFAGGCFWCVEEAFDAVPGVVSTTSGYTGGAVANPTYRAVSAGGTGHFEAVKVDYDAARVSYDQLLETFWRNIDPFDPTGQFCDKGSSYRSGVFVATEQERAAAETTKAAVAARFDMPVATEILAEQAFYPAEDYHQNFYQTNPARYKYYKWGCGRAQRLEEIWGKPAT
jgi:peptide-methionine (S)-S-oxide reductase